MDQWYVVRGNVRKGPFTSAQLRILARKGQLRVSDMLMRQGSRKQVPAGKFRELFPEGPEETTTAAVPVELSASPEPGDLPAAEPIRARSLNPLWLWIGASALAAASFMCVSVVAVIWSLARSGPGERAVGHAAGTSRQSSEKGQPPTSTEQEQGPGKRPDDRTRPGVDRAGPAAPEDGIELPPVGPVKVVPPDPAMVRFKKARAAYLDAQEEARLIVPQAFDPAIAAIEKSNLDAAAKARAKQDLMTEQRSCFQDGKPPTHPVVKKAVEAYTRSIEAATRTFGQAAEEALAAYEQQGVTDAEKLKPLRAGRLCARHADLIGAWVRPVGASSARETWIVDFDERTGGFQVAGIERSSIGTSALFYGEKIEFKDGTLSFAAIQLNPANGRTWATGMPVTMTPQKGTLRYEMRDRVVGSDFDRKKKETIWIKKTVAADLHRSLHFGAMSDRSSDFVFLIEYLKKGGITGLEHRPKRPFDDLDVADANSVWRRLALLTSSGYLTRYEDLIPHAEVFLPYRSMHLDLENRNPGITTDLVRQHETLLDSPHPYLRRAAVQAFVLCRNRLRLAQANEDYGNTASSSVREFNEKIFVPALEYSLLREKDRQELSRANPGHLVVFDGPLSRESQEKLDEFLRGVGGLHKDVQHRGKVSNMLAWADMAEVDRTVAFWQRHLLPLSKRCAGPRSDQPLLAVIGGWRYRSFPAPDKRLSVFGLKNVGNQELTHAVIELIAENEWGEKAIHYCYLPHMEIGEAISLMPHPRWERRLLDCTNTFKVTWSVWADQGTEIDRQGTLTSPAPNPNAAEVRKEYLRYWVAAPADWEAVGALMHRITPLPRNAESQRLLLREASQPGTSYLFRVPDPGKPDRTLLLRFRPGPGLEAEIVDPATNMSVQATRPTWKGQLDPQGGPSIFFGTDGNWEKSGWAFTLGLDDRPMIGCPGGGTAGAPFPTREIPLFLVKEVHRQ